MSLIESARDFMKGLVVHESEVGVHDTSVRGPGDATGSPVAPAEPDASPADAEAIEDDAERLRREWAAQPSHL